MEKNANSAEHHFVHPGSGFPAVSSPKGKRASPSMNATQVSATGAPILWKYETPAPTRNVIPAATKRPIEIASANALARHSVGYCSGSQSVYIAKLAPLNPKKGR